MKSDREVMKIRQGENFDTRHLETWLRQNLPETEGSFGIAQFGGGHANLTYLISFGEVEYVLRRPPLGPIAPSSHDMGREHRVLKDLWRAYPLAPRSYILCGDETIIGAPFHIMERRHGIVIRTELNEGYDWTPELNTRVGHTVIDALAQLHLADANLAGLNTIGHPEGFVKRQLDGWCKRWDVAKKDDIPIMASIITWLENHLPASDIICLLHNDFKLDNMLVDAHDPGRAVAVLDWDMCTRGDPLMDLGYLLTFWGEAGDDQCWIDAASMPSWERGFPTRAEAVERYAQATGFNCDEILWYHIFGTFKIAVVLQQIYVRYLAGQTQDQRFAVFGDRITALIDKARVLAKL